MKLVCKAGESGNQHMHTWGALFGQTIWQIKAMQGDLLYNTITYTTAANTSCTQNYNERAQKQRSVWRVTIIYKHN